jgi:hypothetical protein
MRRGLARLLLPSLAVVSLAGSIAACGSSSGSPMKKTPPHDAGGPDTSKPKDASADVVVDPKNCVPPGTSPNSAGAGGYCSPGGGQCDMAGPEGTAEICTADLTGTPAHAWYCTLPCEKTTQCGAGATCASTPSGSRCVPKACLDLLPEGGLEDSEVEGSTDAGPSDAELDAPPDASDAGH